MVKERKDFRLGSGYIQEQVFQIVVEQYIPVSIPRRMHCFWPSLIDSPESSAGMFGILKHCKTTYESAQQMRTYAPKYSEYSQGLASSLSLSLTYTLSLHIALFHTHTHIYSLSLHISLSLIHTHIYSLSLHLSLSLSNIYSLSLSLSLSSSCFSIFIFIYTSILLYFLFCFLFSSLFPLFIFINISMDPFTSHTPSHIFLPFFFLRISCLLFRPHFIYSFYLSIYLSILIFVCSYLSIYQSINLEPLSWMYCLHTHTHTHISMYFV